MAERTIETAPETEKITKLSITSPKITAEEITQKSERMIKLKTMDEIEFLVEESVARELEIVRAIIEEEGFNDDNVIPLFEVSSNSLSKIIEHCKKHQEFRARTTETLSNSVTSDVSNDATAFDQEFLKNLTANEMKNTLLAANFLCVKDLVNLLGGKVADHIANKSVEYVREFLGIENDYTPEEEAELREQNSWAFMGVDDD